MPAVAEPRSVVLQAVRTVPGSHLRSLERMCRMPLGTLRYHLDLLLARRDVAVEQDRRYRRFYPGDMQIAYRRVWDALRQRQTRAIVLALLQGPLGRSEIAFALGLSPSSMHLYGQRLKALGVVREANGRLELAEPQVMDAVLQGVDPTRLDLLVDGAISIFDQLQS